MQIVAEARKHFNTMNVEHFYSLYKALMIWKREVCSFYLISGLHDLFDAMWWKETNLMQLLINYESSLVPMTLITHVMFSKILEFPYSCQVFVRLI